MHLQCNQKGTVQLGVAEAREWCCSMSDPVKWSKCLYPKLCKGKQERRWGCNFIRRMLLSLVAAFATVNL